jgi:hypothetical protein
MNIQYFLQVSNEISLNFSQKNYLEQRDLKILELIYINSHNPDSCLTVNDVIGAEYLGSRATLHRCLHRLRESHLVEYFNLPGNYRTKFLRPSKIALDHFRKINVVLLESAKLPHTR